MKVLAKLKREPGLWLSTAERPVCGENDVIIHIKKTAICGTDLHIYKWDQWAQGIIPVPMHVGHEFVGEIAEIGSHVKHLKIGDRVSGEGHVVCGYCRNCRGGRQHLCGNTLGTGVNIPGAFAEYLSLPAHNAFKLPDLIPDNIASILDPLGNAVHTALSFDLVGEDVLITGAGPVGLMAVAVARHVGARHIVVTDINPYRLKLAETLGASRALNVQNYSDVEVIDKLKQTMAELGMEVGFDVGLEMSGQQQAISSMIDTMTYGGKMALLGVANRDSLQINWNKIVWRGLFLKGIYGREMYETWYKMISLLQSGLNINPLITHEFPVDDYLKGFELMESGQCGKVILDWRAS